jgi:hypothetical protein
MALIGSTLDTPSRVSLSARAAQSSASLMRIVALPCVVASSWVEVSAASTGMMRAASTALVASYTRVTSTNNAGTFALPQDMCCRSKDRRE